MRSEESSAVESAEDLRHLELKNITLKKKLEETIVLYNSMVHSSDGVYALHKSDSEYLSNYYNKLLLGASSDIVFILDNSLNFVLATDAALSLMKPLSESDLKGMAFADIFVEKNDWIDRILLNCKKALSDHQEIQYDDHISLDGENVDLQILIRPSAADGKRSGLIVLCHNITDLNKAKDRAFSVAQAKNHFLTKMSHEIRTPMNAIKGFGTLFLLTDLNEMQREYGQSIVNATESLLTVVNDIMDFSKIEDDRLEIVAKEYSIAATLYDVANIINLRASERGLSFLIDIDPNIPSSLVGDNDRIKQVLLNLLGNAVKFTKEGYVKLSVKYEKSFNNVTLFFKVSDTGTGIKEEDISHLFEAFKQLDQKLNRGIQGTGLGLSISKRLVELMGGSIRVESVYGKGSSFYVSIPQVSTTNIPMASVRSFSPISVLVYADDIVAESYIKMLERLGVPFECCRDKDELDRYNSKKFTHLLYRYNGSKELGEYICRHVDIGKVIATKNIRYSYRRNAYNETSIYEPLLIKPLAKALSDKTLIVDDLDDRNTYVGEFSTKNACILIVDDNLVNLSVTSEILKYYGISSDKAEGGEEAIELVRNNRYDIILMDHMMPNMDGIETTIAIRSLGGDYAKIPIVALTANVIDGMQKLFEEVGMNDFLSKPIEIAELNRVIKTWLPREKVLIGLSENEEFLARLSDSGLCNVTVGLLSFDNKEQNYISEFKNFSSGLLDLVAELSHLFYSDPGKLNDCLVDLKINILGLGIKHLAAEVDSMLKLLLNNQSNEAEEKLNLLMVAMMSFSEAVDKIIKSK